MCFAKMDKIIVNIIKNFRIYLWLIYGTTFHPKRTVKVLNRFQNKFSFGVLFFINVFLVVFLEVLSESKKNEDIQVVVPFLSSINIDIALKFLSFFIGSIIFSIGVQCLLKHIKKYLSFSKIIRTAMYSSSIFIPIVFIDEFKSFIYSFYNYDAATIQDNYEVFFLVLSISILLTVICKLWWFYIITLGLKITRMKEKWCIVAVIGAIELFNIAFTYGPIVPKVSGIISLAEKVDNYRELRNNMIVKFNNIKKGISSTDEINQLIDEIYTAQLITFDLAINKDMPGQFQYRYAVSSMIYFLFTEDITNKETLLMVDLVLNDDFVNAEKTLTNYIDKIEDAGLVKSSVLKALLEVVEKNQIYQKNYIDKGQSKDEDTIKMVFEFQKRQGLWGKLMLLTP